MSDVTRPSAASNIVAAADDSEQRGAHRFTLLIRAAKLTSDKGEFLCVVRDVSETGVSVRLFSELPENCDFILEMADGDRHRIEPVWQEEDRAGFRFLDKVDIARIIANPGKHSKRAVRINLELPLELLVGLQKIGAQLHNVSQQGALISTEARLAIEQRLRIRAPGLPEIEAKVRWRKDGEYGLIFEDTFQFGDLARLTAALQLGRRA